MTGTKMSLEMEKGLGDRHQEEYLETVGLGCYNKMHKLAIDKIAETYFLKLWKLDSPSLGASRLGVSGENCFLVHTQPSSFCDLETKGAPVWALGLCEVSSKLTFQSTMY